MSDHWTAEEMRVLGYTFNENDRTWRIQRHGHEVVMPEAIARGGDITPDWDPGPSESRYYLDDTGRVQADQRW